MYGYVNNSSYENLDDPNLKEKIRKRIETRPAPQEIILNKDKLEITLAKSQRLDLGSIGKGYATDLAFDHLAKYFPAIMINAGGDVRAIGVENVKPSWNLDLYKADLPNTKQSPNKSLGVVRISDGSSIAGSGGWIRRVKFFHHLINPRTGLPENKISQTYALAENAIKADAWATVLFLMGEEGIKLAHKNNIEYIIINANGNKYESKVFQKQ